MKKEKPRIDIPPLLLEGDQPSSSVSAKFEVLPRSDLRFQAPAPQSAIDPEGGSQAPGTTREVGAAAPGPSLEFPAPVVEARPPPPVGTAAVGETPAPQPAPEPVELPESYGTGRLFLLARDPHWLYAHWDIPSAQQREYNHLSASNHLLVRVQSETGTDPPQEIHVHPESRHWFIHVEHAAASYAAQLGYYESGGQWQAVAASASVSTPPDQLSEDKALQFAIVNLGEDSNGGTGPPISPALPPEDPPTPIPRAAPAAQVAQLWPKPFPPSEFTWAARVLETIHPHRVGWIPALETGQATTRPQDQLSAAGAAESDGDIELPVPGLESSSVSAFWTSEKEGILAELLGASARRQSQEFAAFSASLADRVAAGISSPLGQAQPAQDFWFHINAELVIYGSTEPDAVVAIGGQRVQLREDGKFSLRLALPDGRHELPVLATSARGETRHAQLHFTRETKFNRDAP